MKVLSVNIEKVDRIYIFSSEREGLVVEHRIKNPLDI